MKAVLQGEAVLLKECKHRMSRLKWQIYQRKIQHLLDNKAHQAHLGATHHLNIQQNKF